jgi:L-threonylcarbamoyladenylate synthase
MHVDLAAAQHLLEKGDIVAIPTETVYGLAALAHSDEGIAKIFACKRRPSDNPLIVHLASAQQLQHYLNPLGWPSLLYEWENSIAKLADAFWPGPLTLVVPAICDEIATSARAGLKLVAFRVPAHPLARALIAATGPLVAPSANLSGKPSGTCIQHVERDFGKDFPVVDGGECERGIESTILYPIATGWSLVRPGAVNVEDIEQVLGHKLPWQKMATQPICPGMHYRHYSPETKLYTTLDSCPSYVDTVLGFEERSYPRFYHKRSLGSLYDPQEVGKNLYATLRALDGDQIQAAFLDLDFPSGGLWLTIRERLERAAHS